MVLGSGHAKLLECDIGKEQEKMAASHMPFEDGNTSNNGKDWVGCTCISHLVTVFFPFYTVSVYSCKHS